MKILKLLLERDVYENKKSMVKLITRKRNWLYYES